VEKDDIMIKKHTELIKEQDLLKEDSSFDFI
jgi:hypothetical protein